jgi:hypothetical protein
MHEQTPENNLAVDGIIDDLGIVITHPELLQEHPSKSSEWLEKHKLIAAAIGGTLCTAAGVIVGNMVLSRDRPKRFLRPA